LSEQTALEFKREKWRGEYELRKREIELKECDASRSRWSSPVVLALLAAAIAGLGNAAAIWLNGMEQRKLETTKTEQTRSIEETKAEAARILEVIRTDNPDKAAANLKFLLDAGLISDADRRASIRTFLDARAAGQGPALPTTNWLGDRLRRDRQLEEMESTESYKRLQKWLVEHLDELQGGKLPF
jgi:hypothetical protein